MLALLIVFWLGVLSGMIARLEDRPGVARVDDVEARAGTEEAADG
jgi:hypothetical protein